MKPILQVGRNCWKIERTRDAGVLVDGRDFFRAFYRAARRARNYILISGWQFDSAVKLLDGEDEKEAHGGEVRFMPFLDHLCRRNPDLQVKILAWDFSLIYTLKREFLQDWLFNWHTCAQIEFRFDNQTPIGACHHQKFAVIDGHIAFVGGLDICSCRWDLRGHRPDNPLRVDSNGKPCGLHHDIQAYMVGPCAAPLTGLFLDRWRRAGGPEFAVPPPVPTQARLKPTRRVRSAKTAISRTQPPMLVPMTVPTYEIRSLYQDAIDAAEKVIYIENQYFSSQAIYKALVDRMRASRRSRLQIIMVLPKQTQGFIEEMSMGATQSKLLPSLRQVAADTGHDLGIYYSAWRRPNGAEKPVYIHSKLLLVDDRFLSVGSANTNNRSMGLDTELNLSWEATSVRQRALLRSIRRVRVDLLAEHAGIESRLQRTSLGRVRHLVRHLDRLASDDRYRLRRHPLKSGHATNGAWEWLGSGEPIFDPEKPPLVEDIREMVSRDPESVFARGITWLNEWLAGTGSRDEPRPGD